MGCVGQAFGVDYFIKFMMSACYPQWVSGVKKLPLPHRWDGRGSCALCHLTHGVHELNYPYTIGAFAVSGTFSSSP